MPSLVPPDYLFAEARNWTGEQIPGAGEPSDTARNFWFVRRNRDGRVLRARAPQPVVHRRVRRGLSARFRVRISSGGLAIRTG